MTKNQKIMLGIGAAAIFCMCAVGVGFLALRTVFQKVGQAIVTDPAKVAAVANRIAKFDIPAGYQEEMGMDFGLYQIVMLQDTANPNKPMIMLMGYKMADADPQQMQEQMQQALEQQTGQPGISWTTVDQRKVTIRGQEVNLIVREGHASSGFSMRQAIAAFNGANGTVLIMIQGDTSAWDDTLVNNFLASIR